MTNLTSIHEMLLDTQAAIEQTKRAIAENPDRKSLFVTLGSLEHRQSSLEAQFLEATNRVGLDVCSYRMFLEESPDDEPGINAISSILSGFQQLFTLTYDATKNGPKRRAIISKEIEERTSFNFGYAFSGSTGIVLTIPRDRQIQLFGDTASEEAASSIFTMLKAKSPAEIREVSNKYGPQVVRALLSLVKSHLRFRIGADVEWMRGNAPVSSGFFQRSQFQEIEQAILETSTEVTESMTVVGFLEGANVRQHKFDIKTDDGTIITGTFKDAIDESHTVELPKRYRAIIKRTVKLQFSTEEEQEAYFLESLEGPLLGN